MPADTSVVLPMYGEAHRIGGTVASLVGSSLDRADAEWLFVDDGSIDDTVTELQHCLETRDPRATVQVISRPHLGKGAAVAAGFAAANGRRVAFSDADLSAGVEGVERVLDELDRTGADVVAGRRQFTAGSRSARRAVQTWLFRSFARLFVTIPVRDPQCGLKGFTADAAQALFEPLMTSGWAFDVEILARAKLLELDVRELDVPWTHQPASTVRPMRDATAMLREVVRIRRALRSSR